MPIGVSFVRRWAVRLIPGHVRHLIRTGLERVRVLPRKYRLRWQVKNRHFTVVSCNCWGAEIYRDLKLPYLTPFVGLFILPDDYLTLLENFSTLIFAPLEFTAPRPWGKGSFSPVGLLGGRITIQFAHYRDDAEAREKWERRRARMVADLDQTFFMFCDRDGCTREHLERFDRLPFRNKVSFVARPVAGLPHAIVVPPRDNSSCVEEGPQLFDQCQRYFSVADWLNRIP